MSRPYIYDQGDNETDYKWVRRLITRAAMLDRELADARERLRSAEAVQRWIPLTERHPDDDRFVLAYGKHGMQVMAHYANGEFFCWNHYSENWDDPIGYVTTHWIPLPPSPSDKEQR